MTSERAVFDTMPPQAEREIWCEWLRRHSINPDEVLVPGWIERRPATYQVAYLSAEFTEHGCVRWNRERGEPVYTVAVAQLEGPPLPFPVAPAQPVVARMLRLPGESGERKAPPPFPAPSPATHPARTS